MKNFLVFLFVVCSTLSNAQTVPIVDIPDFAFKNYLLSVPGINLNGDNEIQVDEANGFNGQIVCSRLGINDLTGIEAFLECQGLFSQSNNLTEIDLTLNQKLKTVLVDSNRINSLVLAPDMVVERLGISENLVTQIDLSGFDRLEIFIGSNNPLETIDVSNNQLLERLIINNCQLNILDLSNNLDLELLSCSENQLTEIELGHLSKLIFCGASNNQFSKISLPKLSVLEKLFLHENNLTEIDLSKQNSLLQLVLKQNQLTTLSLPEIDSLNFLWLDDNGLETLDISKVETIFKFNVQRNNLRVLDLSSVTTIYRAVLVENDLEYLNVANGNNEKLEQLIVSNNPDLDCIIIDDDVDLSLSIPDGWPTLVQYNDCCQENTTQVDIELCEGDTFIAPSGEEYSEAGSYEENLWAMNGCDSLVYYNVQQIVLDAELVLADSLLLFTSEGDSYQWFNCAEDFQEIEGAIEQYYLPESNGYYAVQLESMGCLVLSECVEFLIETTSITNISDIRPQVFPNPNNGDLSIRFEQKEKQVLITVFDGFGKLIQQESSLATSEMKLHLNAIPGIYTLIIQTGDKIFFQKIVKT